MDLWLLFKNWARCVHRAGSPTCEQWAGVMVFFLPTSCLATPCVQVAGQVSGVMGAPGLWCGWRWVGVGELPCIEQAEDRSPGGVGELEEMVS